MDNTNRGAIWPNKKKEKDTHPDFTGSLNVDGVEFWVNAWKRKEGAPSNAPSLSFTVRPKEAKEDHQSERPRQGAAPRRMTGGISDTQLDDEIPFAPEFR